MQVVVCLLCANYFRNSPGLAFYRIPKTRRIQREYVRLSRNANLKLNSDSTQICTLLVFLQVKYPRHMFLHLHIFMFFFFLSIPPSFLLFWAVLTPLKHSTPLSAMFVYIHVPPPPNNPINARAPSSGPRLSLFSEVSYRKTRMSRFLINWGNVIMIMASPCCHGYIDIEKTGAIDFLVCLKNLFRVQR